MIDSKAHGRVVIEFMWNSFSFHAPWIMLHNSTHCLNGARNIKLERLKFENGPTIQILRWLRLCNQSAGFCYAFVIGKLEAEPNCVFVRTEFKYFFS